jgi:hypothetical protein
VHPGNGTPTRPQPGRNTLSLMLKGSHDGIACRTDARARGVPLGGTVAGLDPKRASYRLSLTVGTYYILFAAMGGSAEALIRGLLSPCWRQSPSFGRP